MAVGHPPRLDTNDRQQAHDPDWQAAQVAAQQTADPIDTEPAKPQPRGRHEKEGASDDAS
jgi:hypothetical protein